MNDGRMLFWKVHWPGDTQHITSRSIEKRAYEQIHEEISSPLAFMYTVREIIFEARTDI